MADRQFPQPWMGACTRRIAPASPGTKALPSLATGRVSHTAWCRPSPRPRDLPINHPRTFTPAEANALLPTVRPLVERVVAAKRAFDRAQERNDEAGLRISGNGGGIPPAELGELHAEVARQAEELAAALDELQEIGLLVKDLDSGLVDFPSERDGRPVLLCWQLGEDEVAWYHGHDDGFAGRRPL